MKGNHFSVLSKEKIGDEDGGEDAREIGQQATGNGVANVANADRAEINGDHIERRLGTALHHGSEAAGKGVGTVSLHGLDHQAARAASAKRFHQGGGQSFDEAQVPSQSGQHPTHAIQQQVQGAAGPKNPNRHQHGHQKRNDVDGHLEAFLRAFNEFIVNVDAFQSGAGDENHDHRKQNKVADESRLGLHGFLIQPGKIKKQAANSGCHAAQISENGRVQEVDALHESDRNQTHQAGDKRGDENRDKNVGGIGGALLSAVKENSHGKQRHRRGVDDQKKNLRIAGGVFLWIEGLKFLHGFEAHGGGGVVQSQHIGGDVHEHGAKSGMALRNGRENLLKQRLQKPGGGCQESAFLPHSHEAKPERHNADQAQGNFEGQFRHFKNCMDHLHENIGLSPK